MQEARPPKDISHPGNQADDAVDAEADRCPGDAEPVVKHMREQVEVFVIETTVRRAARAGRLPEACAPCHRLRRKVRPGVCPCWGKASITLMHQPLSLSLYLR